ncbi:MAG: L-seryl-tRNA(Sec) selenium transferase [Phycisphaerae bacterium]
MSDLSLHAFALRELPSVDHALRQPAILPLLDEFPREELIRAIRDTLDRCRAAIRTGKADKPLDMPALALDVRQRLYERTRPHLRRVINATGIVLHTGLGRAPLAQEAIEAVADVSAGYCNLELDLATGERGDRHAHVRELLIELCNAEDGLVVNNNAAATVLALRAIAAGREVVVSRGQLVEIGGSYRLPEIMAVAGCRMVEVGTTNRTRLADYRGAATAQTAALLRVHTSNYRVEGFVESTPLAELAALRDELNASSQSAARNDGSADSGPGLSSRVALIDDLGSGVIDREWFEGLGIAGVTSPSARTGERFDGGEAFDEPSVRESLGAGADVVLFSGDKLLGGPQAGIIVGRAALIAKLRRDPLMRALRPDKMTLAALEATLRLYRAPVALARKLPTLKLLTRQPAELEHAAQELAAAISRALPEAVVECAADRTFAGGGSLPTLPLATFVVRVRVPEVDGAELTARLRKREQPVIARLHARHVIFDTRALLPGDADAIAAALSEAAREQAARA